MFSDREYLHPHPDGTALIDGQRRIPYAELDKRASAAASVLVGELGIKSGDRVATLAGNSIDHAIILHAAAKIGVILAPLNTRLTVAEIGIRLDLLQPRCILADGASYDLAQTAQARPGLCVRVESVCSAPEGMGQHTPALLRDDDDAYIVFTSGSTAAPKGVPLSWGNIRASAAASSAVIPLAGDDVWLCPIPIFHVGGLSVLTRSALAGSAAALPASREPAYLIEMMKSEGVTIVSLVPTMLHRLLDCDTSFDGRSLPRLRAILLGGASAPRALLQEAAARSLPVLPTYGMTETASQVATMPTESRMDKSGTVGRALPGVRIAIRNPDGREAAIGESGEICIAGPQVMRGYLNDSARAGFSGAEFHSGDTGSLDTDGFLSVYGRMDDLIVSGGENIRPQEVEDVLLTHPSVRQAFVVGLEDPQWGQIVAAVLVPRGNTPAISELENYCRMSIAGYKVPKRWLFMENIPLTPSGKPIKAEVRDMFRAAADRAR